MYKDEAILIYMFCINEQVSWASEEREINSYMANNVRKILNDLSFSYFLLTMVRETVGEGD